MMNAHRFFIFLTSLLFSGLLIAGPMNFQGRLLDNNGIPLTQTVDMKICLYNMDTGGSLIYEEEFSVSDNDAVDVDDGVYALLIGDGQTPLTGTWNTALWTDNPNLFLEVQVHNGASYESLLPRHRIGSSPFAMNTEALGNRSADDYDKLIGGSCKAGKGKWLSIIEKCLGVKASITNESAINMTTGSDFSDLNLNKADLTGTDFTVCDGGGSCNFQNTIFKGATISHANFDTANLTGAVWDEVVLAGAYSAPILNLTNATIKNMDISNLDLSNSVLDGLSAAELDSCQFGNPSGLPTGWTCVEMRNASGKYMLIGPGADLSAGSAASVVRFGSSYLNVDKDKLNGANLTGVSFVGNTVSQHLENINLTNADFSYTVITNTRFNNATILNTKFIGSLIDKPVFMGAGAFDGADFTNAKLNYVSIEKNILNPNFTGATLKNVDFQGVNGGNFTLAVLDDVRMQTTTQNNIFDQTRFYNQFQHGASPSPTDTYLGGSTFQSIKLTNVTLSGDFKSSTFTGVTIFDNVTMDSLNLCHANIPLLDTISPHDDLASVTWGNNITCPKSFDVNGGSGCNTSNYWTAYTFGTCDPGVN